MSETAPTRLADARLVRDLRKGAPGTFFTVWNGMVPDLWSVLLGVFEDEGVAIGWASTFRLELAESVSRFTLDEPLAVQVGRVLLHHVAPAVADSLHILPPTGRAETPDETLRTLPPAARLHYLVDLFFHVAAASETPAIDLAVLHLMEPGQHTDARRTAQSLLQRLPPDDVLLHPPGQVVAQLPDRGFGRVWKVIFGIAALGALAMAIAARPHTVQWVTAADQCGLSGSDAAKGGFTGASDPEALALALIRDGARVTLVEIPDLGAEGLTLIGGGNAAPDTRDEAVLVFYTSADEHSVTFWTLAHTAARLPADAIAPDGSIAEHLIGDLVLAGWVEPGGSWVLCGPGTRPAGAPDRTGTSTLATHIRDRRKGAVEEAGR